MFFSVLLLAGCGASEPKTPPRWSPFAQKPRDENFHGGQNALLLKYDANKDGSLTRAELTAGLRAEFAALDTRHTGCLDPEQVAAINAARIAADQSTATPLQDWDDNGCVDFREFATTVNSLYVELDRNGDGTISPQEFNPTRRGQPDAAKPPVKNGGGPGGGQGGGPGGGQGGGGEGRGPNGGQGGGNRPPRNGGETAPNSPPNSPAGSPP